MGHGMSVSSAAYIHAGAGPGLVEKSGHERRCIVADALNAVISLSNAALLFSYIVSIGAIRLKRLRGGELLQRRWSLGKWGALISDVALAFLVLSFVLSFFPETPLPGAEGIELGGCHFCVCGCGGGGGIIGSARGACISRLSLVKRE